MTEAGPRIVARFAAAAGLAFEVWRAAHILRVLLANGVCGARKLLAWRPRCNSACVFDGRGCS